jgi:hypothetical protein
MMNLHSDHHNWLTSTAFISGFLVPLPRDWGKQASTRSIASNHSSDFFRLAILRSYFRLRFVCLETGVPGSTRASSAGINTLDPYRPERTTEFLIHCRRWKTLHVLLWWSRSGVRIWDSDACRSLTLW